MDETKQQSFPSPWSRGTDRRVSLHAVLVLLVTGLIAVPALGQTGEQVTSGASRTTRFFEIRNVPAEDLLPLIREFLSNEGKAVADNATNLLIVSDTPSRVQEIARVLKRLDQPLKQVMLKAMLVQASDELLRSLRVQIRGGEEAANEKLQARYAGQYVFFTPPEDTWARVQFLLQQKNRASQSVSTARVVTMNRQSAEITLGTSIPIPLVSRHGRVSLQYRDVVFLLRAKPHLLARGDIQVDLMLREERLSTGLAVDTQETRTSVVVKDGHPLLIGGADRSTTSQETTAAPSVSGFPLLARLLGAHTRTTGDTGLLIVLRAEIMDR